MTDSSPSNSLALGGFPITAVRLESRLEFKFHGIGTSEFKTKLVFSIDKTNIKKFFGCHFYIGNRTNKSPDKERIST